MNGHLFIVSGPTGVGKTTLINSFVRKYGSEYNTHRCVTYTTRKPRYGEIEGKDYHFVSEEEFDQKVEEGFFLEWSNQYIYKYGTPRYILDELKKGRSYILVIDRVGVQKVLKENDGASIVTIFIAVSSISILNDRINARNSCSKSERDERLRVSFDEIKQEKSEKLYQFTVLNDDFDEALNSLKSLFKEVFLNF